MKKYTWIVTSVFLSYFSTPAFAWEGSILLEEGWGHLRGYTQTPQGGTGNSTSTERPSFKEVNISHDSFFHLEGMVQHSHFLAFADYFRLHPNNDTILQYSLLTHSRLIPSGSPFDMSVHYDWYQFGIGLDSQDYFSNWCFNLSLAANWLKYNYRFSTPITQSSRAFNLLAATIGLSIERCINEQWSLDASAETALPLSRLRLFNGSLGINYLFMLSNHLFIRPRISLGSLYIDYEDKQAMPNHLRYQLSPYVACSLLLSYRNATSKQRIYC